ncbi:MAG: ATP-binding protein [Bacteroidota bacterium]
MRHSYHIGCSLGNLQGIREFIRESLSEYVSCEVSTNDIVLAIDEMCSNLMIHSHQCNPEHYILLTVDTSEKSMLVFEITDSGNSFDINAFHEPELNDLVHEKRKGGLGIRLVKAIMDQIEYVERNGKMICRLSKRVAG